MLYTLRFSLQNAVSFIMLTCLVSVLFTFYIQGVLKLKKKNSGAKGLTEQNEWCDAMWRCVAKWMGTNIPKELNLSIFYHEDGSSRFLRNVATHLPYYIPEGHPVDTQPPCKRLVSYRQGRRLGVAGGATAPGPALEGAPRFRPMSLSSYILR